MTNWKTGIHTAEIQTLGGFDWSRMPSKYRRALTHLGGQHYIVNVPMLPDMSEYNSISQAESALKSVIDETLKAGSRSTRLLRVDYRFDDHEHDYAYHLRLMQPIVYLIAYASGVFDRRVLYMTDRQEIASVRAMPDEKDSDRFRGVEFFDKENQAGTCEYGKTRLELRRMWMQGECLQFIIKEWANILRGITCDTYKAMLKERVGYLTEKEQDMPTLRRMLIAREEEGLLQLSLGKARSHYTCQHLPNWAEIEAGIKEIVACLDRAVDE